MNVTWNVIDMEELLDGVVVNSVQGSLQRSTISSLRINIQQPNDYQWHRAGATILNALTYSYRLFL